MLPCQEQRGGGKDLSALISSGWPGWS